MALCLLFPGQTGIWKCRCCFLLFLWREENQSTPRKTLGAGKRANNKLNPHMMPSPGFKPGPHWWETSSCSHHYTIPAPQSVCIIKCGIVESPKIKIYCTAPNILIQCNYNKCVFREKADPSLVSQI